MSFRLFGKFPATSRAPTIARSGSERSTTAQKPWQTPKWLEDARKLDDGAPLGDILVSALQDELHTRAVEAGAREDWPQMALSNLHVRKNGLPDWWLPGGNLLLTAPDAKVDIMPPYFAHPLPVDCVIALGAGVTLNRAHMSGAGGIVVVGDRSHVPGVSASTIGRSTISIGEDTAATFGAVLDARNGGSIISGAEGLWAADLFMMTDDGHAIRDLATRARINVFGGRIVVERHVWFSMHVRVMGDCRIGADTVIGMNSFVKNSVLPPNSVCVGQPARPVRMGTTWSRWDEP